MMASARIPEFIFFQSICWLKLFFKNLFNVDLLRRKFLFSIFFTKFQVGDGNLFCSMRPIVSRFFDNGENKQKTQNIGVNFRSQ